MKKSLLSKKQIKEAKEKIEKKKRDLEPTIENFRNNPDFARKHLMKMILDFKSSAGLKIDDISHMILMEKERERSTTGRKSILTFDQLQSVDLLASLGLKPTTIGNILNIRPELLKNYLKKHPEFKQKFENRRIAKFVWALNLAMNQAGKGWWPAVIYILENIFGDFMKKVKLDGMFGAEGETEKETKTFKVTVEKTKTKFKTSDFDSSDEEGDQGPEVKNKTASSLGENVSAEDAQIISETSSEEDDD